jgi:23S rRNA-/tRNA-specific pseudouridylate synthase
LDKLINSGVMSFKIEGRLKDENYVKNTVLYYHKLLKKYPRISKGRIIEDFAPNIEKTFNDCCIVNIKLHTGRTHQIRGYFAHIGHFVLGDNKYGNKQQKTNHDGYYLTAYKVKFNLQDELKYLNDINIEITPTWIDEMK